MTSTGRRLSWRPTDARYEWVRYQAYTERVSIQNILDEAVDNLRAITGNTPNTAPAIPGQYDLDGQVAQ